MSTQPTQLPLDESVISRHNIACAVAVVANERGVKPQEGGVDEQMNKIVHDVMNAYDYTLWYLEKYHLSKILNITERPQSSVWKPS